MKHGNMMKTLVGLMMLAGIGYLSPAWAAEKKLKVVTTVAPITNIVKNVAGSHIDLHGIIPEGMDSHTFEPVPSDVKYVAEADLIIVNGLHLETPTEKLANANMKKGAKMFRLGDNTISRKEWVFDFSFPEEDGSPNPHLWLSVAHAMKYAALTRDALVQLDPAHKADYENNTKTYLAKLDRLDKAIMEAMKTVPPQNRKLITYHDSFAYYCPRYGCTVIGAIQPSDFAQPSPREVAALIDQLKKEGVPAIFGSEVYPSKVEDQIASEIGIKHVTSLRDDDLPGAPDAPEHTYVGMMLEDVRAMVGALGGNADALKGIDPANGTK
jgi:ABC-type Zn uptake system ZnuABC Zn-binding protein ZnuA